MKEFDKLVYYLKKTLKYKSGQIYLNGRADYVIRK